MPISSKLMHAKLQNSVIYLTVVAIASCCISLYISTGLETVDFDSYLIEIEKEYEDAKGDTRAAKGLGIDTPIDEDAQKDNDMNHGLNNENQSQEQMVERRHVSTSNDISCTKFNHGDITPLEDDEVQSIFNCGSKSGLCHWYFPAKFLHESCGVGKEFVPELEHMKSLYESRSLWLGGPPILVPAAVIQPENMKNRNKFREIAAEDSGVGVSAGTDSDLESEKKPVSSSWTRHNLSMIHVHKAGGTSLVQAFDTLLKRGAKGRRHMIYYPEHKVEPHTRRSRAMYEKTSAFLDGTVKYRRPDEWGETNHILFAAVRDPADRFISAIGQATGAPGSRSNGIGEQLMDACLRDTSKETLNCFIDLMHTNSTWIELHFTPQVLEISFATMYKDIPVAIFPFEEVPNLLIELGANPKKKKKDGKKAKFRKSSVLTMMTVDDYDDDMLKKLCNVYKIDVIFMNHLGLPNKCDKVMTL